MTTELREPDEYFLIGEDDSRLAIYLRYQLFKALEDFAQREQREQVGLLVGRVNDSESDAPFLVVEDAIESPVGDENTGRFDESLWKRARRIAAARHPNRVVVGWFHTHPEGDVAISEEERTVHKRHFPEEHHLLYLISSKGKDRNFYFRGEDGLTAAQGFRIYGKTPAAASDDDGLPTGPASVNTVSASPEQQTRQIERNIEKIQRRLQSPPMLWKDYLIVALLVMNAMLIWFRPNPPVKVDNTNLERGQADLSAQVSAVKSRIEKLERHLADLSLLDEQLKLAAGLDEDDPGLTDLPPEPAVDEPPSGQGQVELSGGQGVITLYEVKEGDVLGVLVEKFYPDAPEGTLQAFSRFNRLKGDAIFPGDTLKVPSVEVFR